MHAAQQRALRNQKARIVRSPLSDCGAASIYVPGLHQNKFDAAPAPDCVRLVAIADIAMPKQAAIAKRALLNMRCSFARLRTAGRLLGGLARSALRVLKPVRSARVGARRQ